jgi:hypothetical protein
MFITCGRDRHCIVREQQTSTVIVVCRVRYFMKYVVILKFGRCSVAMSFVLPFDVLSVRFLTPCQSGSDERELVIELNFVSDRVAHVWRLPAAEMRPHKTATDL